MGDNNKMNQGQNDFNKKPGMGAEKVSNPGIGNQDQGKNPNKMPGQKIDQDMNPGSRQVSNKQDQEQDQDRNRVSQGQSGSQAGGQSDVDDNKATQRPQRPNVDRDTQK